MNAFSGEYVLVVGLGASGMASARVLVEEGATVRVSECRPMGELEDVETFEDLGVEVFAGGHTERHLEGITLMVVSPGVPEHAPVIEWAQKRGIPVWSELELGARLCKAPLVAITGTNGKTTATEMVAAIMRTAGMSAVACGNIGYPFSLAAREPYDALAVEASSFQLRFHESFHPKVSVLLNIAPDHLDWHSSMTAYANAKSRIFALQGEGDFHIGNADDGQAAAISGKAPCSVSWFRLGEPGPGEVGYVGGALASGDNSSEALGTPLSNAQSFRADAAAAAAACLAFGIDPAAVSKTIDTFEPLAHRGETVATVAGIDFVNDSKATNPHAVLASLANRSGVVLIAGGMAKGVDLSPLLEAESRLAAVVAMGESAPEIIRLFGGTKVPVREAASMRQAVETAFELASSPGTVVLAPAAASQDMFRDYRDRGEQFAAAAADLVRREAADV